jgi:hypothetical protein
LKRRHVSYPVVGGKNDHDGVSVSRRHFDGRQADAGSGVFTLRLGKKILASQSGQLLAHGIQLLDHGDHEGPAPSADGDRSARGFTDEAFGAQEFKQLLRTLRATQGPKACALTARHDDAVDLTLHNQGSDW